MWFDAVVDSVLGDKNKGYQEELRCPYMLCPSNIHLLDTNPTGHQRPPKMKFMRKIQPQVYEYRCKHCGCLCNVSVEMLNDGRESWRINPSLIGGKPSFNLNWRR